MNRLDYFMSKRHLNRFWWFQRNDYLPPLYADLSEAEFALLVEWFEETERLNLVGECNVPAMSALLGFIAGNGIDAIVQCGHYAGYSSLLMGWMLRRMGKKRALFSIDLNLMVTNFAQKYIDIAGLDNIVFLSHQNSSNQYNPYNAIGYFTKPVKMVFIDSSHQYEHTLKELDLWYGALAPGGLMFLHDVGEQAVAYDKSGKGGVRRAVEEWKVESGAKVMMIELGTYQDGCGLGVIQK